MPRRWSIPQVLWAIDNGGAEGRIAVAYVEWAAVGAQDVVVDWMVVEDEASARAFGERLMAAPRRAYGSNAIGAALLKGLDLIEENRFDGWRKVIDLSGDSSWNPMGPTIAHARDAVLGAGVVINGLAILCRPPCSGRPRFEDLEAEYAEQIIGGPGAFVVTADGRESFAQAVRRKLILEIADLGGRVRGPLACRPETVRPPVTAAAAVAATMCAQVRARFLCRFRACGRETTALQVSKPV